MVFLAVPYSLSDFHHNCNLFTSLNRLFTLNQQSFNLILHSLNLLGQLTGFIGGNTCRNNSSANTTSTSQGNLRWHKNVRNILVFAEEWEMEEDFNGRGISGHDDEFRD